MDKKLNLYEISSNYRIIAHIYAENSSKAKRIYCKNKGISTLQARKLNASEESTYLERSETLKKKKGTKAPSFSCF